MTARGGRGVYGLFAMFVYRDTPPFRHPILKHLAE